MSPVTEETQEPAAPDAVETPAPDWVWMRLTGEDIPQDAAPVRFPNNPTVIEHQEARNWVLVDEPQERPFTAATGGAADDPQRDPWVTLVHPGIDGGTNRVPNDPAALQGAFDAGWQLPPDEDDEDQPEPKPAKRNAKKQASTEPASDEKEG